MNKLLLGFATLLLCLALAPTASGQDATTAEATLKPAAAKPAPPRPLPANVKNIAKQDEETAREIDKQLTAAGKDEQTAQAQYSAAQATRIALQQARESLRLRLLMKVGVTEPDGWEVVELVDRDTKTARLVLSKQDPANKGAQ